MAYNISKLEAKFAELNGDNKNNGEKKGPPFKQWKPQLGDDKKSKTFNVRLLPYEDQNGQPFQEVSYYDNKELNPWRLVAPAQFGLEDPIAALVQEMRKDRNNKEAWPVIKKMLPRTRYFAPVLVREEASEGVQVWELSPTLCKEFYKTLVSEDYREETVSDPLQGRDFQVTVSDSGKVYTPPASKKSYPVNDVGIMIRAKQTKLASTAKEIEALVASVPDLLKIFKTQVKPVSEIKQILENFLSVDAKETNEVEPAEHEEVSDDLQMKAIDDEFKDL